MVANEQVQKYYDALLASYDILTDAVEKANERGLKMSKQFVADVTKGQREALEIGKKLSGGPGDAAKVYAVLLEATTAAQGRALAFSQVAYQEALGASTDARTTLEKLVNANKETVEAAVDMATRLTANNPFADAFRKGVEAMTVAPEPAARAARKEPVSAN